MSPKKPNKDSDGMFYYQCRTCGNWVGQIDDTYVPWCSHTLNRDKITRMTMMEPVENNGTLKGKR